MHDYAMIFKTKQSKVVRMSFCTANNPVEVIGIMSKRLTLFKDKITEICCPIKEIQHPRWVGDCDVNRSMWGLQSCYVNQAIQCLENGTQVDTEYFF